MKLWHYRFFNHLSKQRLQGLHKECCGMRGNGWGTNHYVVNYVWKYNYTALYFYHMFVITKLEEKNVNINELWKTLIYRGKKIGFVKLKDIPNNNLTEFFFKEHNEEMLKENLHNLKYYISTSTKKQKNVDLFHLFPIRDEGYYDYEYWENWFKNL